MRIILSILVGGVLLLLAGMFFYFSQELDSPSKVVGDYLAKRDDLYLSEQRVEDQIKSLQKAIDEESAVQDALTDQIIELSDKADLPPPVINKTTVVQDPPETVVIPKPQPKPVARAS